MSFVIVAATISVPGYILGEVVLSFLGVGVQEPAASWGNMLNQARSIRALTSFPWLLYVPGMAIFLTVMAFNFLGDGLRDALDPAARVGREAVSDRAAARVENLQDPLLHRRRRRAGRGRRVVRRAAPGETLAVVGESGSGKSVTALSILRLVPSRRDASSAAAFAFKGRDLLDAVARARCGRSAARRSR